MPVFDLLWQGAELMALGMGIVFCFLALLVVAMNAMSAIAKRFEGEQAEIDSAPGLRSASDDVAADERLIAAISGAVAQDRSTHP